MAKFVKTVFCQSCSKKLNIFQFLSEKQSEFINEFRHEVRFNAGEMVFKQGGALTHIACVTSGYGKVYIEGVHKKNLLLKILQPTEMIAGPGLFTDYRHHYSVRSITDLTACFIEVKAFEKVIEENPVFAKEVMKWINGAGIRNYGRMINLTQKQMHGRIADTLLYLSNDVYNSEIFTVNISRQDIADIAAMSKESAIRIIKEFKDAGYIHCEGNNFEILEYESLNNVSLNG